jgi:pyrroloquinoline quinone biosynthesis protein D
VTAVDPGRNGTLGNGAPWSGAAPRPGVVVSAEDRPRLARHVRLTFSETRQQHVLQLPETVVVLHGSGADILALCDGRRTVAEIVAELGARYRTVPDDEVRRFLARLVARRCVELIDG